MQSYIITNVMGQDVAQKENLNSNSEHISLSKFAKGLHFIKVTSTEGITTIEKVVVQ